MSIITLEVARQEFDRFTTCMDLDVSTSDMNEEEVDDFDKIKNRIVKAICNGSMIINDNGEPVFTPQRSENTEPITFHEPTGDALMSMDRRKKNENIAKMYAVMGAQTKNHAKRFTSMKQGDLNICMAVTSLFLV